LEDVEWFALYGTTSDKENWLADFVYKDGSFYDSHNQNVEASAYIKSGNWRFTLYGYPPEGSGSAKLKGTATANITAGFNGTVNFTLSQYIGEGDGTVSIRIGLPQGSGVASVETTIDGTTLDPPLPVNAGAIVYTNNEMPAGQYLFSFTLKDSAGETLAVISDIVVVAEGAESTKQYTLTGTDLNSPPSAPSDFTAESYNEKTQSFHFTWLDNSLNETAFTLSDGTTTRSTIAAVQSYDFPITDPTAEVTYILKAVNAFGESTPAQISGPIAFTITFDTNIESETPLTVQAIGGIPLGTDIPSSPTRTDYSFGGWYTDRNGEGKEFNADTMVVRDTTVYAKWIIHRTVTFNLDGGTISGSTTRIVNDGASLGSNAPPNPSRNGSTFGGWWTAQNGEGVDFTSNTIVTANITVYAKWTVMVTFSLGGGNIEGVTTVQTRTVNNGASLGSNAPPNPSREGYAFGGWYTAQNGEGTQFTPSTTVNANITIYAKWTLQRTVTFDLQGGAINGGTTWTVNDGTSLGSNMPSDPVKSGSTFGGWYTAQNGGGTQFTSSILVSANITVYAKWTATVTFNLDGGNISGSTGAQTQIVNSGTSIGSNMPSDPVKNESTFGGWYTSQNGGGTQFTSSTLVSTNITVYAKWMLPSNLSLIESLTWLNLNAVEDGSYTITLKEDEIIGPHSLSYDGKNVGITLIGGTTERWVILNSNGSLFTIASGVTLTLDNVVLQGRNNNTASLVLVNDGGSLRLEDGSGITSNTVSTVNAKGAGVYVGSSGTFEMSGGTVSGNTVSVSSNADPTIFGGGVYVDGTFVMSGGAVSGNTLSVNATNRRGYGGGVYVSNSGTFTMSGGEISGNTASRGSSGVDVEGTFTMNSGSISGNFGSGFGGGVRVSTGGTFTMWGGTISDNISTYAGGGVLAAPGGTFEMNGGTISGNTAPTYGGGVCVDETFTMRGGEISGNTVSSGHGGGVYVGSSGIFIKQSGGIIYGSDASASLKNTATSGNNYGHAVCVGNPVEKKRNTTAGEDVRLNSGVSGSAGGWE
jgi:uncharacterized repeat protein (TIGR02543 family)